MCRDGQFVQGSYSMKALSWQQPEKLQYHEQDAILLATFKWLSLIYHLLPNFDMIKHFSVHSCNMIIDSTCVAGEFY